MRSLTFATLCLFLIHCGDDSQSGGAATGGGGAGAGVTGGSATGGASTGGTTTDGGGGAGGDGTGGSNVPPGCTEVTQAGPSTLYSIGGVGFTVAPPIAGAAHDVVVVSPQFGPTTPLGTAELTTGGDVFCVLNVDAVTDLLHYDGGDPGILYGAVAGTVTFTDVPDRGTQWSGLVSGTLQNVQFVELDADNQPIEGGACYFLSEGTFGAGGYELTCEPPGAPSAGACMADYLNLGHDCNPLTNAGCEAGEICDFGANFSCFAAVGDETNVCEACDNVEGPYCVAGATCDSYGGAGQCNRFCCEDADCGPGGTCISYAYVPTVGVCLTP